MSNLWDSIFSDREWGKYPPEYVVRHFLGTFRHHEQRAGIRVLDLGCGPGACTWFLAREGFKVYAIDGSTVALKKNIKRLRQEGLSATILRGDFTQKLPWDSGFFDVILDNASLYSNSPEKITEALIEIRRVLGPGGTFLSLMFAMEDSQKINGIDCPWIYTEPAFGPLSGKGKQCLVSRSGVKQLFKKFESLSIDRLFFTSNNEEVAIAQWLISAKK